MTKLTKFTINISASACVLNSERSMYNSEIFDIGIFFRKKNLVDTWKVKIES